MTEMTSPATTRRGNPMSATLSTRGTGTTAAFFPGAADLAEGYLIATEFGSTGGSEIETNTEMSGNGVYTKKKIKYDSMELRDLAQRIVNSAYTVVRKFSCPAFSSLYFVHGDDFDAMDEELEELREAAHELNLTSREKGSDRLTKIEVFPLPVERTNSRIALRIGKSMHEYLTRLRETYESDNKSAFNAEWRMCRNLNKALVGVQEATVREALRSTEDQRPLMIAHVGGKRGTLHILRDNHGTIPPLNYGPIDRAIALFAPAAHTFE